MSSVAVIQDFRLIFGVKFNAHMAALNSFGSRTILLGLSLT